MKPLDSGLRRNDEQALPALVARFTTPLIRKRGGYPRAAADIAGMGMISEKRVGRVGLLLLLLSVAWPLRLAAVEDVHVVALFKDRVVVMVDGKRRLLRRDETSPEGIKLISADSRGAVLDYRGRRLERRLDGRVKAALEKPAAGETVRIYRNSAGMFRTVGSINGLPVHFLVDTGASAVAMNAGEARRLGIDFRVLGDPVVVSTASGVQRGYSLKLDVVRVGDIRLRQVRAIVMDGTHPTEVLLGMTFLGRLELRNQGDRLELRRKF